MKTLRQQLSLVHIFLRLILKRRRKIVNIKKKKIENKYHDVKVKSLKGQ